MDEEHLSELAGALERDTHALSVEQLEQLRASLLNVVWRHRQEWERREMVEEMRGVVREFVEEVEAWGAEDDE